MSCLDPQKKKEAQSVIQADSAHRDKLCNTNPGKKKQQQKTDPSIHQNWKNKITDRL